MRITQTAVISFARFIWDADSFTIFGADASETTSIQTFSSLYALAVWYLLFQNFGIICTILKYFLEMSYFKLL